jgi:hypothetical protein
LYVERAAIGLKVPGQPPSAEIRIPIDQIAASNPTSIANLQFVIFPLVSFWTALPDESIVPLEVVD